METIELIKMLIPVIILQFALLVYSLIDLHKNGVRNLNKTAWILIIVFINMLGPISYLLFGRGNDNHVED